MRRRQHPQRPPAGGWAHRHRRRHEGQRPCPRGRRRDLWARCPGHPDGFRHRRPRPGRRPDPAALRGPRLRRAACPDARQGRGRPAGAWGIGTGSWSGP